MARTVATLFDRIQDAQAAFNDLIANGCKPEQLSLAALASRQSEASEFQPAATGGANDTGIAAPHEVEAKGIGRLFVTGRLAAHLDQARQSLLGALVDADIPEDDARPMAEGVRRGNLLLLVEDNDDMQADRVVRLLSAHHPIERGPRERAWRESGWRGFDEATSGPTPEQLAQERGLAQHRLEHRPGATYPQDGAGGGVWSGHAPHTRDERAIADHARAERLEAAQAQGFGPEKAPGHPVADNPPAYRQHFDVTYPDMSFPEFLPAYRYGALLASSATFEDHDWDILEPQAQRDWEHVHPHTWDRYRGAVHFGWEHARGQRYTGPERRTQPRPGRRQ